MRPLRPMLAVAVTGLLSACAAGPNYHRPETPPAVAQPFLSAQPGLTTAEATPADWWRLYQDPILDALVGAALTHNRDVAVAQANLRQVRALLSEARTGYLPSTAVTGAATRARQPDITGRDVETDTVSAGFQVAYEVDLFGRVRRGVEAARAEAGAAEAGLDAARVLVAAETARAYAESCAANAQIAVARRTLDLFQESADLTRRQLDAGRGTGLDVARAVAQLEGARAAIPSFEAQRDSALFRLAVLLGRPPAQFPAEVRACAVVPQVAQAIPVGDGAALLRRRPDVRQAERRLAAATARIGVATASLYPSVRLGGGLSTIAGGGRDLGDSVQFSIGPLISWSFPNLFAARARIRQADAAADAAMAAFEQSYLTALQEAETALTAYAKELDRRTALRKARDEGARAVRLSRMRQEAGLDSFLSVLDAERTLATLEAQLAQSEAQIAANQVAVFKALGGGWTESASTPPTP